MQLSVNTFSEKNFSHFHNPDKPEQKRNWLVREITKYKSQITNKPQSQNYKLQIKGSPCETWANFIRLRRGAQLGVFFQAR
jgi:hypothetical protein